MKQFVIKLALREPETIEKKCDLGFTHYINLWKISEVYTVVEADSLEDAMANAKAKYPQYSLEFGTQADYISKTEKVKP